MRQYVPDIQFLPIKMNGSYQSVFVTTNIEYKQISNSVNRWEDLSQCTEILKTIRFYQTKPAI
jgi:hypothetical protein